MPQLEDIYIVSGARTAIGDFGGALKSFYPSDLGAKVVEAALERAGVPAADVEHVVVGQVMPTGAKDEFLRSRPACRSRPQRSRSTGCAGRVSRRLSRRHR
jgi:acetyl-CoA acetyltransferase